MSVYEPFSRRPIAGIFRKTAYWATEFCLRLGISADQISYCSIICAVLAAVYFWQSQNQPVLLVVVPLFCLLRLWCNMLDGMVALAAGAASPRGEIINDLPDRVSDVLIFIGAAHSNWMHPLLGYWAALMSLGTAYVGILGQAVGGRREFGGWMSKPWRMVVLGIGTWATCAFLFWRGKNPALAGLTALDWSCAIVIAGCLQTSALRLIRILRRLKEEER